MPVNTSDISPNTPLGIGYQQEKKVYFILLEGKSILTVDEVIYEHSNHIPLN